jgi:hypothetical protein
MLDAWQVFRDAGCLHVEEAHVLQYMGKLLCHGAGLQVLWFHVGLRDQFVEIFRARRAFLEGVAASGAEGWEGGEGGEGGKGGKGGEGDSEGGGEAYQKLQGRLALMSDAGKGIDANIRFPPRARPRG